MMHFLKFRCYCSAKTCINVALGSDAVSAKTKTVQLIFNIKAQGLTERRHNSNLQAWGHIYWDEFTLEVSIGITV